MLHHPSPIITSIDDQRTRHSLKEFLEVAFEHACLIIKSTWTIEFRGIIFPAGGGLLIGDIARRTGSLVGTETKFAPLVS